MLQPRTTFLHYLENVDDDNYIMILYVSSIIVEYKF